MTTEERDARLTAYALNDPGLSDVARQEVEETLRTDPAARQALQETLKLAQLLTAGLAAEQAALPAEPPVAIPSSVAGKRRVYGWINYAAAAVLFGLLGGTFFLGWTLKEVLREAPATYAAVNTAAPMDSEATPSTVESTTAPQPAAPQPMGAGPSAPTARGPGRDAGLGGYGGGGFGGSPPVGGHPPGGGFGGFGGGLGGMPGGGMPGEMSRPGGMPGMSGQLQPTDPVARPASPAPGVIVQNALTVRKKRSGREFPPGLPPNQLQPGTFGPESLPSPNDRYRALVENEFVTVAGQDALSTFGVDVDTASYAIVRKYLTMGQMPPADAVRLEELVNYFRYQDKAPEGDDPFAVTVELAECPWQPKHRLARIGVKAKPIDNDKRPPSNLVFLVDVSGSMGQPNKLPLVQASLRMLVNQLGENDRVAMVVYAGAAGLVLDSTSAMHKDRILEAIDRLQSGGSTNGEGGLRQAYGVASAHFIRGGTNRVILCTDGDWNVGTTGTADLVKLIEEKRKTGVFLSVFGFGMGNLRDEMMVQLAGKGNGNYGYIDSLKEANKALVEQIGGTLVTVAKDVKIQVEFNPAKVGAYRLLGYEKRALAAKDFDDDKKDAGEMGAGHVVTALYELVPAGAATPAKTDDLRYQPDAAPKPAAKGELAKESFVVKMRHKKPDSDKSTLRELPVTDPGRGYAEASEDFRFAAAVASFAMLLRDSPYKGDSSFALVQELAAAAKKYDPGAYRAEFLELVKKAKAISGRP